MLITLNPVELHDCIAFSRQSAFSQQEIEFGQTDTVKRGVAETARDTMIGKVAEVAVSKMLNQYGLHCPVDFGIYERGEWDDSDLKIFRWDVDVKSTATGRWLFMERHKLQMRKDQKFNRLPDALLSCNTEWDLRRGVPTGNVNIHGIISLPAFLNRATQIRKGDTIPNTNTKMQADNYGVLSSTLPHDWMQIIDAMYRIQPIPKDDIELRWANED